MNQTINNLQHQVESALMQDSATKDYGIEVLDSNGVITLRGAVPNRKIREQVESIVHGVAGVTNVINELDVV